MKVTALTSGRYVPSSRFRIRQFIEPLRRLGVSVAEHHPPLDKYALKRVPPLAALARLPAVLAARAGDVVWLERELIADRHTLERFVGARRLFDVDDAIWLLNGSNFSEKIAAGSLGVIAGNEFIADHYRRHCERVWVVPTSLDTRVWKPPAHREGAEWVIGWTGTSSNLPHLLAIEEPLADFLSRHDDCRLLIVCDREPRLNKIPARSRSFVRWSPENEVASVQRMNVGLMPLPDTQWARGKCALKMLMYMAVGIPLIASPVGVGDRLIRRAEVGIAAKSGGEWYEALRLLFDRRELASVMGMAGRKLVEEEYSVAKHAVTLADIFREAAETKVCGRASVLNQY
jgi:glycosyltransferase involved in cell wall biosynthesis